MPLVNLYFFASLLLLAVHASSADEFESPNGQKGNSSSAESTEPSRTRLAKNDQNAQNGNDPDNTSCHQWDCLAMPYINPYIIDLLEFQQKYDEHSRDPSYVPPAVLISYGLFGEKIVPIPNVSLPEDNVHFKGIKISFLDDKVLEFIESILPHLNNIHVSLKMFMGNWGPEEGRTKALGRLLNLLANKIGILSFKQSSDLPKFNRLYPNYIDQIDAINIDYDIREAGIVEDLVKWLTTNEKQRSLEFTLNPRVGLVGQIMNEFMNAKSRHTFVIHLRIVDFYRVPEFKLENEKTGETLTYMTLPFNLKSESQVLLRCPKGEEGQWWTEGLKKLLPVDDRHYNPNETLVEMDFGNIGTFTKWA